MVQRDRGLAQGGLEPEAASAKAWGLVRHHRGLGRVDDLDGVERSVETRGGIAHEIGQAAHLEHVAVDGLRDVGDQP